MPPKGPKANQPTDHDYPNPRPRYGEQSKGDFLISVCVETL